MVEKLKEEGGEGSVLVVFSQSLNVFLFNKTKFSKTFLIQICGFWSNFFIDPLSYLLPGREGKDNLYTT